ncbi:MAG TPA: hypothetical protein VF624_05825 [Tepidisphaeraceae bacterium]|jgi:hypothetical protein
MPDNDHEHDDAWDAAVAARLGRLRRIPVDTAPLRGAVAAEMDAAGATTDRSWWARTTRPVRAVAASLLLVASVVAVVMLTASSGSVYARADEMAAMHRELVNGNGGVMKVDSVDAAQRALSHQWAMSPDLPDLPEKHVMACCLRKMNNKRIACVLLDDAGTPVSMMVADGGDVKHAATTTLVRGGTTFYVETADDLNMVATQRDGRWVCLIGERSVERLMELAGSLRF